MKKTTKYVIITAAIALVLGGILAVLYFTDPAKTEEESSSSSTSSAAEQSLLKRNASELKSITVKGENADFTILAKEEEASSESSESSSSSESEPQMVYSVEGYEDYDMKQSNLKSAAGNFTNLTYIKELGEVENLSEYGLDNGTVATATYSDGTSETFTVGREPGETAGRYILYKGKVYVSAVNQVYYTPLEEQINPVSWSITDVTDEDGNTYSNLDKFIISGEKYPRKVEMYFDEDSFDYSVTEPIKSGGSMTYATTLMDALKEFNAGTIVKTEATEEDLKEYGFETPYADMTFAINGEEHSIVVGAKEGNDRYIYVDGNKKIIYKIANNTLAPWADADETKFRDGYVNILMITKVNKITVEGKSGKTVIDLSRTVNEEKSTENQTSYDYTAKRDGVDIVYKNITKFYSNLISIPILNMQETATTGEALFKITYGYYDGSPETKMEFFQSAESEDRYIVKIDGEYNSTIRKSSIDAVEKALADFIVLDPTTEP